VLCQRPYKPGWTGKLRFITDGYVLKREVVARFYGPEIAP